jgi:alcohol dehydrogenase
MKFDCHIPTKILFGAGRLNDLATVKLPGKKALIVISGGTSMRNTATSGAVKELLAKQGVETLCLTKSCPTDFGPHNRRRRNWRAKKAAILSSAWEGGAVLTLSKSIAVMAKNPATTGIISAEDRARAVSPKKGLFRLSPLPQPPEPARKPTRGR